MKQLSGLAYVLHYGMPQLFFHVTAAYASLRHNGLGIFNPFPLGRREKSAYTEDRNFSPVQPEEDAMEQQTRHPLRENQTRTQPVRNDSLSTATAVDGTLKTHPIDGSQYLDVIEEQEYADRRPTAEEQKPRFSYLHQEHKEEDDGEQSE